MPIGQAKFGLLGGVADLGKLELIETQEVNQTVSALEFTNLQESTYNVHLLTISDGENNAGTENPSIRLSNNGGSSYISTGSLYQYAQRYQQATGTLGGEIKSSGADAWFNFSSNISGTNARWNGYIYFYNLGDSSKFSFYTSQTICTVYSSLVCQARFGIGLLKSAQTINAFKIDGDSFNGTLRNGVYSLYGIAQD